MIQMPHFIILFSFLQPFPSPIFSMSLPFLLQPPPSLIFSLSLYPSHFSRLILFFSFSESHGPWSCLSLLSDQRLGPYISVISSIQIEKSLQRHGGRLKHYETYCGSCYGASMVKLSIWTLLLIQNIINFMLEFVCKLLNKYCWKLFCLCCSDLFNSSLYCSITLFFKCD